MHNDIVKNLNLYKHLCTICNVLFLETVIIFFFLLYKQEKDGHLLDRKDYRFNTVH